MSAHSSNPPVLQFYRFQSTCVSNSANYRCQYLPFHRPAKSWQLYCRLQDPFVYHLDKGYDPSSTGWKKARLLPPGNHPDKSMKIGENQFKSIPFDANTCQSIQIDADQFKSIPIDANRCQSMPIDSNRYQSIQSIKDSLNVAISKQPSINIWNLDSIDNPYS